MANKRLHYNRLGALVEGYRKANDITQRDLARQIGICASTLGRFEQGKKVDADTAAAIIEWVMAPGCITVRGPMVRQPMWGEYDHASTNH